MTVPSTEPPQGLKHPSMHACMRAMSGHLGGKLSSQCDSFGRTGSKLAHRRCVRPQSDLVQQGRDHAAGERTYPEPASTAIHLLTTIFVTRQTQHALHLNRALASGCESIQHIKTYITKAYLSQRQVRASGARLSSSGGTHSQFFVQWPEMRAGPKERAAVRRHSGRQRIDFAT